MATAVPKSSNRKKKDKEQFPIAFTANSRGQQQSRDHLDDHGGRHRRTVAYYAWFLQTDSASKLVSLARAFLSSVTMTTALLDSIDPNGSNSFHVTAKYCGKQNIDAYAVRPDVLAALGAQFDIRLTGLLLRPGSSLVARAELGPGQLVLWDNEPGKSDRCSSASRSLPRGSRAHITLATAPGVAPAQAGFDLLDALATVALASATPCSIGGIGGSFLCRLSGGRIYLTLGEPLIVSTVFGARH